MISLVGYSEPSDLVYIAVKLQKVKTPMFEIFFGISENPFYNPICIFDIKSTHLCPFPSREQSVIHITGDNTW